MNAEYGFDYKPCLQVQNRSFSDRKTTVLSPDLAIESDVTSKTESDAYIAIQVPELWVYGDGKLFINLLQNGEYVESPISSTFPDLAMLEIVPRVVDRAWEIGTSQALLEFEEWLSH